jgi:hypothetical protein
VSLGQEFVQAIIVVTLLAFAAGWLVMQTCALVHHDFGLLAPISWRDSTALAGLAGGGALVVAVVLAVFRD